MRKYITHLEIIVKYIVIPATYMLTENSTTEFETHFYIRGLSQSKDTEPIAITEYIKDLQFTHSSNVTHLPLTSYSNYTLIYILF